MLLSTITKALKIAFPEGCIDIDIHSLQSPHRAMENDIIFLSNKKYLQSVISSQARFVIVRHGVSIPDKICLCVPDPYVGYAKVAQLYEHRAPQFGVGISSSSTIDPTAVVHETASIGPGTIIGAHATIGKGTIIEACCVIEKNTHIGDNCRIDSSVIIRYNSVIGNSVIIQSGAIIGSDGFGNACENNIFLRIPPFGNVIIEDDAEIGANTTIDRGNFESTIIGKGVKLDNLIHVAHNVTIDEHTAIAAQTGISGSTTIGKRVIIAGQAGFVGHIHIGDDSFIGAKSGVSKDVTPGEKITGYPARGIMSMRRIESAQSRLPDLLKEFKKLKSELSDIKKYIHHT